MGNIPIYTRSQSIPGSMPDARGSMQVAGQVGRAISGFGRELEALKKARQANDLTENILNAAHDQDELNLWASQQTDYQTMVPEYLKRSKAILDTYQQKIKDPDVYRAWSAQFRKMNERGLVRTQELAIAREKDHHRATLQSALNDWADRAAAASTYDDVAGSISHAQAAIAGAIKAGTIDELAGEKMHKEFTDAVNLGFVKRQALKDPVQTYKDLLEGKYPGISETQRTDLLIYTRAQATAFYRERVRLHDLQRKEERDALKKIQTDTLTDFAIRALKGNLPDQLLIEAGKQRFLTPQGLMSLSRFNQAQAEGHDDPEISVGLYAKVLAGSATIPEILDAVGHGITAKTAITYMNKLKQTRKEDDISKTFPYKEARAFIKANLKTTGAMGRFDKSELPRIANAWDEFDRRVREGEDIRQVRDDIVQRYRPSPESADVLPKPLYGTKQDLKGAYEKTREAYANRQIPYAVYRRELLNIRRLLDIQERMNAQGHAMTPAELERKLKERKSQQ